MFIGRDDKIGNIGDSIITLQRHAGLGNDGLLIQIRKNSKAITLSRCTWNDYKTASKQDSLIQQNLLTYETEIFYKQQGVKRNLAPKEWTKIVSFLNEKKFYHIPSYVGTRYIDGSPIYISLKTNTTEHYVFRWSTIDSIKPFLYYFEKDF